MICYNCQYWTKDKLALCAVVDNIRAASARKQGECPSFQEATRGKKQ